MALVVAGEGPDLLFAAGENACPEFNTAAGLQDTCLSPSMAVP